MDAVQGPLAAIDVHFLNRLPTHEGGEQPCQPEDVVKMSMGDQDMAEILKAQAGLQDLALGALTAIDQEAVFIVLDDLCRQSTFGGGGRGGSAQEDDLKHESNCTSFKKRAQQG